MSAGTGRRPSPCPMTGPRSPSWGPHSGRCPSPTRRRPWRARPGQLRVDDETWDHLDSIAASRSVRHRAGHGVRQRTGASSTPPTGSAAGRPLTIEWTGGRGPRVTRSPPSTSASTTSILISCKYESDILANASPARLFDGLLATAGSWDRTDWYEVVAPGAGRPLPGLPGATGLDRLPPTPSRVHSGPARTPARRAGGADLPRRRLTAAYAELCRAVSTASARAGPSSSRPPGSPGRPCCGACCGSAAPPTSSSATTGGAVSRPGTGSPARGTGATSSSWRRSRSRRPRPASPGSTGPCTYRARQDGADRDGRRPRRDPLEPRPVRPTSGGEGLPRHPDVAAARVPPAGHPDQPQLTLWPVGAG